MATRDIGFWSMGAASFGTATRQVFAIPADIESMVCETTIVADVPNLDPFYAARPEVAGKRGSFDLSEYVETTVPMAFTNNEEFVEEPQRNRRLLMMKKRG